MRKSPKSPKEPFSWTPVWVSSRYVLKYSTWLWHRGSDRKNAETLNDPLTSFQTGYPCWCHGGAWCIPLIWHLPEINWFINWLQQLPPYSPSVMDCCWTSSIRLSLPISSETWARSLTRSKLYCWLWAGITRLKQRSHLCAPPANRWHEHLHVDQRSRGASSPCLPLP